MYDVLVDSIYGTMMVFALIDTNDDALTIINVDSIRELDYHEELKTAKEWEVGEVKWCDYDEELGKNTTKVIRIK